MPLWGIKWRKFCVAYNFNWLINLLSFFLFHPVAVRLMERIFRVCVSRQRPTATKWNIVQQNILIQQNVVSWWFLSMKAMLDDMIAIWVARYCVVTASQSMLIGKGTRKTIDDVCYAILTMYCNVHPCAVGDAFRSHSLQFFRFCNPKSIGKLQ